MDKVVREYVSARQIPIFGVASSEGFQHASSEWHPLSVMPRCKSVVVFGRPFIPHPMVVDEDTHIADQFWWTVNAPVYQGVARWRGELLNLLDEHGLGAASFGGFWIRTEPTFSHRLAEVEAGLGVYGRFGVCINPQFGCYFYVGVLLTEASLASNDRSWLDGFRPCYDCALCAEVCPVGAIDAEKPPETAFDRELCLRFNIKIRSRYEDAGYYDYDSLKICGRCVAACPWAYEFTQQHLERFETTQLEERIDA